MHSILFVFLLLFCFWTGNRFNFPSVKSSFQNLNVDSNITQGKIVRIFLHLKVRAFLWELVWRRLNMADDVEKLNPHINCVYVLVQ